MLYEQKHIFCEILADFFKKHQSAKILAENFISFKSLADNENLARILPTR